MRKGTVAILLVASLMVGVGAGYLGNGAPSHTITKTVISTTISQTMVATTLTIATATVTDSCYTQASLDSLFIPAGFLPTVSYEGEWIVSIATFAANSTNASALAYVCSYEGSGTTAFYVPLTNDLGGWSTIVILAHKYGSNGTLTADVSYADLTNTNSTTQPYGSVVVTLSIYLGPALILPSTVGVSR